MAAEVARVMQEAAQMVDEAWRELSGSGSPHLSVARAALPCCRGAAGAEEGESQKSPSFRARARGKISPHVQFACAKPFLQESVRTTKRKPGCPKVLTAENRSPKQLLRGKWNGRVSDLTMKEYRDMKPLSCSYPCPAKWPKPAKPVLAKVGHGCSGLSFTSSSSFRDADTDRPATGQLCA